MKKQRIQLIVLVVILLGFVGGYFGLKTYNKNAEAKESEPKYTALSLTDDDVITKLYVKNVNGEFELVKKDDDTWNLSSDETIDIDEDKIKTKINSLKTITSDQVVDGAENLADYGLDDPAITIKMTLADGTEHTLKIGDYNQTASAYYMTIDDISTIYTVSSTLNSNFSFAQDSIIAEASEDAGNSTDAETSADAEGSGSEDTTDSDSTTEASESDKNE